MIPFSPPRIDDLIINEVVDTLKSGWITTGPKTLRLENEIKDYTGASAVVCLNSATAGLELVLRWYGVKPGDEVIIPAYTYCATANVVEHIGAVPVFVDVNPNDFNIDIQAIEKAITNRTKVIMPVDIAGLPCDYEAVNNLVIRPDVLQKFKAETEEQQKLGRILIMADAAHSFGASVNGVKQGRLTDVAVFSFHAVKNLTTAEGGAIAFNLNVERFIPEVLTKRFKVLSLHGQSKDAFSKLKPGAWRYDVEVAGFKCNMTDIQASIGLVELSRYDNDTLVRRKQICDQYHSLFSQHSDLFELPLFVDEKRQSCYHLYQLRVKNISENQRDEIITRISELGVSVNVHFIPVPMLSYYKEKGYSISNYPVAYRNFSQEISLPVYYDLSPEQVKIVFDAVLNSVQNVLATNETTV